MRAQWLDEARITGYSVIFASLYLVAVVVWVALSPDLVDPNGKPLGTDFMTVWPGGKLVFAGEPASAYDYARHYEVQRAALPWGTGQAVPYYAWHYPPFFLLVAAGLALNRPEPFPRGRSGSHRP